MKLALVLALFAGGALGCQNNLMPSITKTYERTNGDYVKENQCRYLDHYSVPGDVVIVNGKPMPTDPISWSEYICPNGIWVSVDDSDPHKPAAPTGGK